MICDVAGRFHRDGLSNDTFSFVVFAGFLEYEEI